MSEPGRPPEFAIVMFFERSKVPATVQDITRVMAGNQALGAMQVALAATTDYLKSRKQFGVTLNTFQALTFRAADCYTSLELTRSIVGWATMVAAEVVDAVVARVVHGRRLRWHGEDHPPVGDPNLAEQERPAPWTSAGPGASRPSRIRTRRSAAARTLPCAAESEDRLIARRWLLEVARLRHRERQRRDVYALVGELNCLGPRRFAVNGAGIGLAYSSLPALIIGAASCGMKGPKFDR